MEARIREHVRKYLVFYTVVGITVFFGMVGHGYRMFNLDFSHDSLLINERGNATWQYMIGRFLQPLYWNLRGELTPPLLVSAFALVWLSLANFVVVKLLDLRRLRHIVLFCGLISTNVVLAFSFATFLPWLDVYTLAYLFAALAAYVTVKFRFGCVLGSAILMLSLGLYQSYLDVAIFLLMILFVRFALDGWNVKQLFVFIGKCAVTILGGLILYSVMVQLVVVRGMGLQLAEDGARGITSILDFSKTPVLGLIRRTYTTYLKYFAAPQTFHKEFVGAVNIAGIVLTFIALVKAASVKKPAAGQLILLGLCLLAMPFGINAIYFISKGNQSTLTLFSYTLGYAFAFTVFEYCDGLKSTRPGGGTALAVKARKGADIAVTGLLTLIIVFQIVYANQLYLEKGLEFEASESFMTKVTYSIEHTEGYVPGETPVMFIGKAGTSTLYQRRSGFDDYDIGNVTFPYSYTYDGTYYQWFNYVFSYRIKWLDPGGGWEIANEYAQRPEIQAMPVYPAAGSVKIIDGILFVKFS